MTTYDHLNKNESIEDQERISDIEITSPQNNETKLKPNPTNKKSKEHQLKSR